VNKHLLQKSVAGVQIDKNGNLWMATQYGAVYSNGAEVKYVELPFKTDYKQLRSLKCFKMAGGEEIVFYLENSPLLKAVDSKLIPLDMKMGNSLIGQVTLNEFHLIAN